MHERRPPPEGPSRVSAWAASCFRIVLLIAGAGMAALAPPADAQTTPDPTRWGSGNGTQFSVTPARLVGVANEQQIRVIRRDPARPDRSYTSGPFAQHWHSYDFDACEWTAVTPGQEGTDGTCRSLDKGPPPLPVGILPLAITPTATMISNGGVVIRMTWFNPSLPP